MITNGIKLMNLSYNEYQELTHADTGIYLVVVMYVCAINGDVVLVSSNDPALNSKRDGDDFEILDIRLLCSMPAKAYEVGSRMVLYDHSDAVEAIQKDVTL